MKRYKNYLFILPAIILLLVVVFFPALRCFYLSFFHNVKTSAEPSYFVGLSNYVTVFADKWFYSSLYNTIVFTVISVSLEFILGLGMALLLNTSFKGRGLARACVLVPWALPPAVMAMAWGWMYDGTYGVFNDILLRLGIISSPVAWLGKPTLAMGALIFADVWKTTPFIMIILLAGLQSIPRDLYEAIKMDGAGWWGQFRRITLPLLKSYIVLAILFRTIHAFGVFDLVWVLTGGGPGGATQTISLYIYNNLYRYLNLGYAASLTIVTALILLIIAVIISLLHRTQVEY